MGEDYLHLYTYFQLGICLHYKVYSLLSQAWSCNGHQLYYFKERGIELEVEGVRYIEMHRGSHTYWDRLLQGAEISN